MASSSERQVWETFVRRLGELKEGIEIALVLRDLTPGPKKYQMRHVVAVVNRDPSEMDLMHTLKVRTVVGVLLPDSWGVKVVRDLPIELDGKPYGDFYQALKAAVDRTGG
ncbi:MAG: phenylphosphate carboxylase subunit gamma [Candidatus Binatia bacterium]|jgi:hypothetical protein|nr:phenylphosphate carboxylase subunit gamma [Candidatus Binatia bacterium]